MSWYIVHHAIIMYKTKEIIIVNMRKCELLIMKWSQKISVKTGIAYINFKVTSSSSKHITSQNSREKLRFFRTLTIKVTVKYPLSQKQLTMKISGMDVNSISFTAAQSLTQSVPIYASLEKVQTKSCPCIIIVYLCSVTVTGRV